MLIFQIILTVPLILLLEVMVYRKFALRKMTYQRTLSSQYAFEGEMISMVEDIRNNNFLPIPAMKAESCISPNLKFESMENLHLLQGGYHRSVFSIMPYYHLKRTRKFTCMHRGDYNVGNVTITSSDIFGFTTESISFESENRLIVYPNPFSEDKMLNCFHTLQGDVVVRRFINPDPFIVAGVRQYQTGDPTSTINWKATARTNSLQVHKYDYTAYAKILILFNVDSVNIQERFLCEEECRKIENGIHFCAGIVEKCIKQGIYIGFASNGHYKDEKAIISIPPRCSTSQIYIILEALAKLQINNTLSFHTMLKSIQNDISDDTDILMVSLYIDNEIEEKIIELRQNGHQVEKLILDGNEVI